MVAGKPKSASNFLAGATSGCITTLLLQPLDVVKTRMQMSTAFSRTVGIESRLMLPPNSGMWKTMVAVARQDGARGLWRGGIPTIMRNMMGVGLYFVTLNNLTTLLKSSDGTLSNSSTLLAGASARSISSMILLPLTVVKTRFEAFELAHKYNGVLHALIVIGRNEGVKGLFAGLLPTIIRDAPYAALYLFFYIKAKEWIQPLFFDGSPAGKGIAAMTMNFSCGLLGGGLATLFTQPQDVIKTRMQLSRHKPMYNDKYGSAWQTMKRMFNEEGLYGFFRGSSPRFVKRCLGSAITWTIYEETVLFYDKLLRRRPSRKTDEQAVNT